MAEQVTADELLARVATRIRVLAVRRGLSLVRLAELAGVSRRHLMNVLAGRTSPTLASLAKVAAALDVDPGDLVSRRQSLR